MAKSYTEEHTESEELFDLESMPLYITPLEVTRIIEADSMTSEEIDEIPTIKENK